jgi:FkbM family methyltransferase
MLSCVKSIVRAVVPGSIYGRYRRRKVASLIASYTPRDVTHTYGGHSLRIRLADPLAEGWYDHDWARPAVTTFLSDHGVLAPGATVFDFGAHQGIVALMLAREVGNAGRVIAIEAEPHNARIAAANRVLNSAENLTVMHAAGAATEGTASFSEGLNGRIDERGVACNIEVPTVTVDGLVDEHGMPDLVFIDVEGYEGQVLRGATSTLADCSTSFVVEVHDAITAYGGNSQEIVDCFLDYDRYVAADEHEPFVALESELPAGRFFLVALSPRHRTTL